MGEAFLNDFVEKVMERVRADEHRLANAIRVIRLLQSSYSYERSMLEGVLCGTQDCYTKAKYMEWWNLNYEMDRGYAVYRCEHHATDYTGDRRGIFIPVSEFDEL